jgi:hypothetical protein
MPIRPVRLVPRGSYFEVLLTNHTFTQPGWGNILEASCSLSSSSRITELLLVHGADHAGSGENMVCADHCLVWPALNRRVVTHAVMTQNRARWMCAHAGTTLPR